MQSGRDHFLNWIRRKNPAAFPAVQSAIDELVGKIEIFGFQISRKHEDGSFVSPNDIFISRFGPESFFEYIYIAFDCEGSLEFSVAFGVKEKEPPHYWIRAGTLVRRNIFGWKIFSFGSRPILGNCISFFISDWEIFISNIRDIDKFLQSGIQSEFIRVSEIRSTS